MKEKHEPPADGDREQTGRQISALMKELYTQWEFSQLSKSERAFLKTAIRLKSCGYPVKEIAALTGFAEEYIAEL